MQSTETSEWGFYYPDGTLGRCMQTKKSPGQPKSEFGALVSSFHTSHLPSLLSLTHLLAAMVVFHLINPLHVEDEAVQRWLTRTRLVEFAGLPWATTPVHPLAQDILAQLARGRKVVVYGKSFTLCKELVATRLHLPVDGPCKIKKITSSGMEAILGAGCKGEYDMKKLDAPTRSCYKFIAEALWQKVKAELLGQAQFSYFQRAE